MARGLHACLAVDGWQLCVLAMHPLYCLFCCLYCRRNEALVEGLSKPPPGSQPLHFDWPYAASTWQQFSVLMRRWLTSYWRNPGYNATRIVFCVVRGAFCVMHAQLTPAALCTCTCVASL
jgi:hypothetical protein